MSAAEDTVEYAVFEKENYWFCVGKEMQKNLQVLRQRSVILFAFILAKPCSKLDQLDAWDLT